MNSGPDRIHSLPMNPEEMIQFIICYSNLRGSLSSNLGLEIYCRYSAEIWLRDNINWLKPFLTMCPIDEWYAMNYIGFALISGTEMHVHIPNTTEWVQAIREEFPDFKINEAYTKKVSR